MTIEKFRQLHDAQPFHPFVIHLADGRQIVASHREYIALSPSGRTVIIYQADDSHNIIDLLLVTDLEVKANGARRRNGPGGRRTT